MSLVESSGPAQSAFKSLLFDLTTMDAKHRLARELDVFDAHWNANDVPAALTAFLQRQSTTTIATARPSTGTP
jgi:hypothetical protein